MSALIKLDSTLRMQCKHTSALHTLIFLCTRVNLCPTEVWDRTINPHFDIFRLFSLFFLTGKKCKSKASYKSSDTQIWSVPAASVTLSPPSCFPFRIKSDWKLGTGCELCSILHTCFKIHYVWLCGQHFPMKAETNYYSVLWISMYLKM